MSNPIRLFLILEAVLFIAAAFIHSGFLVAGYEHERARVAEGVIAAVLLGAAASTWMRPQWLRNAGLFGQGFALLGTLVGLATIAIGVGPRTAPDIAYHVAIAAILVWGLAVARRAG
jgi:hypothetical protein